MSSLRGAISPELREEFARVARTLDEHGWAPANAGNLSVRLPDGSVVITGAGTTMAQVAVNPLDTLVLVSADGAKREGLSEPSSELLAHLLTYEAVRKDRPWVVALTHTHSPALLRWAACRQRGRGELALEAGSSAAVIPYIPPGTKELAEATAEAVRAGETLLVWERHGVLALGRTLSEGLALIEQAERMAEAVLAGSEAG